MGRGSGGGGGGGRANGGKKQSGSGGAAEGLRFGLDPARGAIRRELVAADVAKLDRSLASDRGGFHVGPGGTGPSAVPGRYRQAGEFLAGARASKATVHATEVGIGRSGQAYVNDGRHRLAALRDSGAKVVPVAVPRGQAARFRRLFGPDG